MKCVVSYRVECHGGADSAFEQILRYDEHTTLGCMGVKAFYNTKRWLFSTMNPYKAYQSYIHHISRHPLTPIMPLN